MYDLVKFSLTGSIIGNALLVLGLSIVAGGLYFKRQTFNRTYASMGATLLALASIGLIFPTLYYYAVYSSPRPETPEARQVEYLSEEIAVILAGVYVLSLIFSLMTHQHLFAGPEEQLPTTGDHQPEWSRRTSLLVLLGATAGVAVMSELLVDSVHEAGAILGLSDLFMGVFVVAVIGNAAEHSTAILVAMKNKMDLSVMIAVGSSLQIALFVAPLLVFVSMFTSRPMDLHFLPIEIVTIVVAIVTVALVAQDGETHWLEGVMLLAVYIIIGLALYHFPYKA
jgi:Ca2+:H+ antiporter